MSAAATISRYTSYSSVPNALRRRSSELPGGMQEARLLMLYREYREQIDSVLDSDWNATKGRKFASEGYSEVIVGGGLHAAIYAANRVKAGHPMPLVLERERPGGVFGLSKSPAFFLNSRNRPGPLGLPSENLGLNIIPGSPIQLASISTSEFQDNSELAWVIRLTLAMNSDVRLGADVERVQPGERVAGRPVRNFDVMLKDGRVVRADRVIDARGLGDPRFSSPDSKQLNFTDFMRRMDSTFPFQDMRRVAVIGGGDSGKVVVESLLGIGPAGHMSVPSLDFVEQIDWYAPGLPNTCEVWRSNQRSRYQALGSFLRAPENGVRRLRLFNQSAYTPQDAGDFVYIGERPYDHLVMTTGWTASDLPGRMEAYGGELIESTVPYPGRQYAGEELYSVGPRANIPFSDFEEESTIGRLAENKVALFRLGGRTALLARRLPAIATQEITPLPPNRKPTPRFQEDRFLGTDQYGRSIYEGDRIAFTQVGARVTGIALQTKVRRQRDIQPFVILRDDGVKGQRSNRDGYLMGTAGLSTVEKLDALGAARDGELVYEGQRVSVTESGEDPFTGRVVRSSVGSYPFAVVRDDDRSGGNDDGAWLIRANDIIVQVIS